MAVTYTFVDGTTAVAAEVNQNFTDVVDAGPPIGGIIPWAKSLGENCNGTDTTVTADKLIDSGATFQSDSVTTSMRVDALIIPSTFPSGTTAFFDSATYSEGSSSYVLKKTWTFSDDSTKGYRIPNISYQYRRGNAGQIFIKWKFFYTDSTDAEVEFSPTPGDNNWALKSSDNGSPTKNVWKIEQWQKEGGGGTTCYVKEILMNVDATQVSSAISSIDSETQLTLATDIFLTTSMNYSVVVQPILSTNYAECNGQVLDDSDSVLNGITLPSLNLNQFNSEIRGNRGSGYSKDYIVDTAGMGEFPDAFLTTKTDMVWIMRVK